MTLFARAVDRALEATVVGSFTRIGHDVRARLSDWTPASELDGRGRTVLVTGANSGLGYASAEGLARTRAGVRLLVRSDAKGAATRERLVAATGNEDIRWFVADLTDLDAVRRVGRTIAAVEPRLDAVVHNAGAMFDTRTETPAGIERTVALHVVGPHLLTQFLVEPLATAGGRVVWMSSGGMYSTPLTVRDLQSPHDYRPATAYARAKRAQVELSGQWQRRVGDARDISFHAMHPGWALTPGVESSLPVFRKLTGPLLRTPEQGADTAVWLCLSDEVGAGGRFWLDRRPRAEHKLPTTRNGADPNGLWEEVERLASRTVHAALDDGS